MIERYLQRDSNALKIDENKVRIDVAFICWRSQK